MAHSIAAIVTLVTAAKCVPGMGRADRVIRYVIHVTVIRGITTGAWNTQLETVLRLQVAEAVADLFPVSGEMLMSGSLCLLPIGIQTT